MIAAAFAVEFFLAAAVLGVFGTGERGLFIALRATARWSFLVFWLAYAGGALATLLGPGFRPIAERGRQFGLAFAAAHLVHAGLVAWLYAVSPKPPVPASSLIFFGVGLFWTYLLAFFSIGSFSRWLGPSAWRILRTIGVEYIAFAFFVDFARNPFHGGLRNLAAYLPFLALALAGWALRLAAWARRRARPRAVAM